MPNFFKMNAHRIRRICKKNYLNIFRSVQHSTKVETEIELLHKQDPQISQISSGITVASIENYNPVSQVSVVIKAGSRYEKSPSTEGLVHLLRNCAALSTKNNSAFNITRSLESLGSKLGVTSTKEHLIYSLECARDNIDPSLEILADVVGNPAFKPWEVNDVTPTLQIDIALHNARQEAVLSEALHKVAFRGGLANSLYVQPRMIGKHSVEMLHNFVNDNFTSSRTCVVGLGVPHDNLQESINKLFHMKEYSSSTDATSKFAPGEIRVDANFPVVHAAIVAEGASMANTKEVLALGVLQCMLGMGSKFSKLGEAAAKSTNNPFHVSCLNINYSDTGLFGVYIIGLPEDMRALAKAVASAMRETSKNISESVVTAAKHKLKAKLMLERETSTGLLSAMATDVSFNGKMTDTQALEKAIDEIQASDVSAIAARVVKAKPAMASVGKLHFTPHVDELLV